MLLKHDNINVMKQTFLAHAQKESLYLFDAFSTSTVKLTSTLKIAF